MHLQVAGRGKERGHLSILKQTILMRKPSVSSVNHGIFLRALSETTRDHLSYICTFY